MKEVARRRPEAMRFGSRCGTCALPVDDAMCRCPWCTVDFEGSSRPTAVRAHASMAARCAECDARVREDWSACPWCGTTFVWTLPAAADAVRGILAEAGAPGFARRLRIINSRAQIRLGPIRRRISRSLGDDRRAAVVAARLRNDARAVRSWERARRWLGRNRLFALDHPLHIPLHEAGHVFQNYLEARNHLDLGEASSIIGDLDEDVNPYPDGWEYNKRVAAAAIGADDRSFLSSYATVHPAEDFAETFAVAAFLRADATAVRTFARYHRRGPAVARALAWMAKLIKQHGG